MQKGIVTCSACSERITKPKDSLRCVNRETAFAGFPCCNTTYHHSCYSLASTKFTSVLTSPAFKLEGLTCRPHDARLRLFVCEICVVRSQGVQDTHPKVILLRLLEMKRMLSIFNAQADSTLSTINTGFNKIASFEAAFRVNVLESPKPFWPTCQEGIKIAWVVAFESTLLNKSGDRLSLSATDCIHQALTFVETERDTYRGSLTRFKGALVHASPAASSAVAMQRFRKGHGAMMGKTVRQAHAAPLVLILDMMDMASSMWDIAATQPWWRTPLRLHAVAVLGLGTLLHFLALYRPGEAWHLQMRDFLAGRFTGQRAAQHMVPPCQALRIRTRTKTDTFSAGSTRHLAEMTRSKLMVRLWSDRLIWTTWRSGLSMSGPLFASWNSPDFMNKLVRPCWKQLQLSVPPCQSSGFLVNADPVLLQSRSFRRGGYQALRRAGVDKTIRDFMMRWTERKTNNTNQESYDDLTAEDTVNASARI